MVNENEEFMKNMILAVQHENMQFLEQIVEPLKNAQS